MNIDARPRSIDFDPHRTAVIVVHMQNNFVSPGGSFAVSGVDTAPLENLIPRISRVISAAREAGAIIVYLQEPVSPQPTTEVIPAFAFQGHGLERWAQYVASVPHSDQGQIRSPRPVSTWNADIVDGLRLDQSDRVVTTPRFSGFQQTELDTELKAMGVQTLVFTGCTTSVCVESTLRDANMLGYDCLLLEDCVAEPIGAGFDRSNHDATLHVVEMVFGWVADSDSFIHGIGQKAALREPPSA